MHELSNDDDDNDDSTMQDPTQQHVRVRVCLVYAIGVVCNFAYIRPLCNIEYDEIDLAFIVSCAVFFFFCS